jgi:hypothetical protein
MDDRTVRAAVERHGDASDTSDFKVEHEIYREDAVLDYPQSGERIRDPGVRDSMPRCGLEYRLGRRCWTPATSITACFRPSCRTVATIRAVRCSDRHEAAARLGTFCVTPTPIFQRPLKPSANTGCRSATHAAADHRRRGSSHRLRTICRPDDICARS